MTDKALSHPGDSFPRLIVNLPGGRNRRTCPGGPPDARR